MSREIRIPYRDRSEPISAIGDLARTLAGEDRAVARQLAVEAGGCSDRLRYVLRTRAINDPDAYRWQFAYWVNAPVAEGGFVDDFTPTHRHVVKR